jgi:putative membrane protein
MFQTGFLGTKAPLFMDITTLIVMLLPFLLAGSVHFAHTKNYRIHKLTQVTLFVVTMLVLTFFEYGVRIDGGITKYIEYTTISQRFIFAFLTFHITIAVGMVLLWARLIYLSIKAERNGDLPGKFSVMHRHLAKATTIAIYLTAITGFGLYYILFI